LIVRSSKAVFECLDEERWQHDFFIRKTITQSEGYYASAQIRKKKSDHRPESQSAEPENPVGVEERYKEGAHCRY